MKVVRKFRASELYPDEPRRWFVGEAALVSLTFGERSKLPGAYCASCSLFDKVDGCGRIASEVCMTADAMDAWRWHMFIPVAKLPKGCRL